MFGKKQAVEVYVAPPRCPEPVALAIEAPDLYEEYQAIARKLGAAPAGILRAYLQREEIRIYPWERVTRFLNAEVAKLGTNGGHKYRWYWYGLRKIDCPPERIGEWYENGTYSKNRYGHTVPIEALRLVEKISTAVPESRFMVSGYEAPVPDPFLLAWTGHPSESFIIAHWDEPGFTMGSR